MAYRAPGASPRKALPGEVLLVIHDFEARSNDELSLSKGDRIELIERDDDFGDGWYLGKHTHTNKTGLFPEVYTTVAPRPTGVSANSLSTASTLVANSATNLHGAVTQGRRGPENATPPPLNTTPPAHKPASLPTSSVPASSLPSSITTPRSMSMIQQGAAEESPVMNETLSVINEHMTDMNIPRHNMQSQERPMTTDSGSEYSSFIDPRMSYIAGHETDEEEHNTVTEQEILRWTPKQVAEHLEDIGVEARHCTIFKEQEITGEVLLAMDQASIFMKEFDLGLVGQRLRTWHKVKALQEEVRAPPSRPQKQNSVFGGAGTYPDNQQTRAGGNAIRYSRSMTNPLPVRQDLPESQSSPSFRIMHDQLHDDDTTPSSLTFRNGLDSPSRPSAASIRDFNHSRRHSAVDFASTISLSLPNEQISPVVPQNSTMASSQHKKAPSLDRNWTMGGPPVLGTRPHSSVMPANFSAVDRNTFDPQTKRASHVPTGSRDLDRGYKSGDEMDPRKARNVLRKRDTVSATHSRQSSYQGDAKRAPHSGNRRHSRFGSVDSIKDTVAALTGPASKIYHGSGKGHFRNSSANEAIASASPSSTDLGAPMVTKLEYDNRPSMKIVTSSNNRDSGVGLNGSPKSSNAQPPKAGSKPRVGLRAISDAVTGTEKSIAASPASLPSPIKESAVQSPARTGSTTPSGASQNLDRESTDASSKGTSATYSGLTPTHGTRRKTKKETSAYIRGLEQRSPQEQMIDCDYSGWMKKKSSNMMTTWKPRLFVLRGRRLSYYYTDDDTQEKGLIDISSHRVLPADSDILTGIHAAVTGAKSSPVSPATSHTPTLAATEAAAQTESSLQKATSDATFIFKLVPPRSGLSRAVNFTKPTVHYFAVDNVRQGRLWMAALMKATIDRDESKPITTSYQLKTISLAKARTMKQRPPALMNLEEQHEGVQEGPKSDETGLNIQGLDLGDDLVKKRTGSLDAMTKSSNDATEAKEGVPPVPSK